MSTPSIIRPPRTMLEVFESLPQGTLVQLIENTLVMSPSPLERHQVLIDEIYPELSIFVKKRKLGATRVAPYDVHLDDENVFQPDILFISNERRHLIQDNGLHGAPDLVIEILSDSTARYDLNEKKEAYARYGVTEYWIVNPVDNATMGYYLVHDEYHEFFKGHGKIASKLLDWEVVF